MNSLLSASIAFALVGAASHAQQRSDDKFLPFLRASSMETLKTAQLRGYSASGTHQCGSEKGRSCIVTGSGFSNCNDASTTLS